MMPSEQFVGGYAAAHMEQEYGKPRVTRQLASGVAVHFGEQAMFIPGRDPERLKANVHQKIQELACAYVAWEYAEEHPQQGDEVS